MFEETVNSYKQADNSSAQQFQDSATYYSKQMTTYMTDQYAEYQKAIMANDQSGIKKYDVAVKNTRIKLIISSINKMPNGMKIMLQLITNIKISKQQLK